MARGNLNRAYPRRDRVTPSRATLLASPIDLRRHRNASDADVAARLHPAYRDALRRLPAGRQVFRGLPFQLAAGTSKRRWVLLDRSITVNMRSHGPGSHVIVAHFCDAWRDRDGDRPRDLPVGWVTPVGQPLARYTLELASGRTVEMVVRRRFEVNEGIIAWGQGAFAARPYRTDEPLDWRGPYPAQGPGRYAAPGEAGLFGILPGTWGPAQTGVADAVPSPTGDIGLWLHEIEIPGGPTELIRLRMDPLAPLTEGGGVVVAAVTLFHGADSPLAIEPRRTLRIERQIRRHGGTDGGGNPVSVAVDLGQVIRHRRAPTPTEPAGWPADSMPGWGSVRTRADSTTASLVELAMAPDASIAIGAEFVPARRLPAAGHRRRFGEVTIESLPTPTRRVDVEIVDAITGESIPARVHFHASDGRYLPPLGHRDEVNPGLNEDTGADLVLGGMTYAYVPGRFPIELPPGTVSVEAVHGFEYRPLRRSIEVDRIGSRLVLPLEPIGRWSRDDWVAADCHVHFISPTTALLQARAEGLAIINLLATQWGDHHTNVADMPAAVIKDLAGRHLVVMGSENRQNMLGHIGLLGAPAAALPMASGGSPEARLGDPLGWLLADWADASHAQRGLALAVHFPLPYAEIAADIVAGKIDAVEMQALTPDVNGPTIREWYRFLNCGYRLPIVGGTDKMSAEIPVGAVRTYARLDQEQPISFEAWADAVRAGRTFVSSGSFVELVVEGCEVGDVVRLGRGGGSVDVQATAAAGQGVIDRLELIHDGTVVAATTAPAGADRVTLAERVAVSRSGWLAARVASRRQIHSAFATSMGAHSSPIYVEVPGRPTFAPDDAAAIGMIIDGARTWVERIATVPTVAERHRLANYFKTCRAQLDQLIRERSDGGRGG